MTSVNRQDAGREVPSHLARFLLEFTPIYDPYTGVYSDLPGASPVFARIFGAIWGVFDEIRTRSGRFLPENGRISAPPCTGPGEQTLHVAAANHRRRGRPEGVYGMCTGMYGFCTVLYGLCTVFAGKRGVYAPEKQDRGEAGTLRPSPQPDPSRLCVKRGSTREIKGLGPQAGPIRRRGIRTLADRATPVRKYFLWKSRRLRCGSW